MRAYEIDLGGGRWCYIHTTDRFQTGDRVRFTFTRMDKPVTCEGVIIWAGLSWCADLGANAEAVKIA